MIMKLDTINIQETIINLRGIAVKVKIKLKLKSYKHYTYNNQLQ